MSDEPPPADTPVSCHVETRQLRPAEPDDVKQSLAFALRYRGRKRVDMASEVMAQITAEHLVEHLRISGFVIMHKPPADRGPDRHYGPSVARVRGLD